MRYVRPLLLGYDENMGADVRASGAVGKGSPMEKQAQNIQEAFLNNARKDKTFLTLYLMSGVKLSGRIKSFDKYSVILETNNQEQLIFKHAISTVAMGRVVHSHGDKPAMVPSPAPAAEEPGPAPSASGTDG